MVDPLKRNHERPSCPGVSKTAALLTGCHYGLHYMGKDIGDIVHKFVL